MDEKEAVYDGEGAKCPRAPKNFKDEELEPLLDEGHNQNWLLH